MTFMGSLSSVCSLADATAKPTVGTTVLLGIVGQVALKGKRGASESLATAKAH
jgi:hypothetical protein